MIKFMTYGLLLCSVLINATVRTFLVISTWFCSWEKPSELMPEPPCSLLVLMSILERPIRCRPSALVVQCLQQGCGRNARNISTSISQDKDFISDITSWLLDVFEQNILGHVPLSLFDHLLIPLSLTTFSLSVFHEQFGVRGVLPSLWARLSCAMCFSLNKAQLWFFTVSRSLPGEPTEKPQPFSCVSTGIWKQLWQWVIQINGHTTANFSPCE